MLWLVSVAVLVLWVSLISWGVEGGRKWKLSEGQDASKDAFPALGSAVNGIIQKYTLEANTRVRHEK